jgi:hypothetical protein
MLEPLMTVEEKLARNKARKELAEQTLRTPTPEAIFDAPITDQKNNSLPLTDADLSFDI